MCYLHFIVEKLPIYVSGVADRIRIQFLILNIDWIRILRVDLDQIRFRHLKILNQNSVFTVEGHLL
jgi:hypothetical protein